MGFQWNPRTLHALVSTVSRSNWNLEMLVFEEGGKPEYPRPEKLNPRSRDENQQQTQPTVCSRKDDHFSYTVRGFSVKMNMNNPSTEDAINLGTG